MKKVVTVMAVIGTVIIIGAIGASDVSMQCSMGETVGKLILGSVLLAPSIIRGLYGN